MGWPWMTIAIGAILLVASGCGPRSLGHADGGNGSISVAAPDGSAPATTSGDAGAGDAGGAGTGGPPSAACPPIRPQPPASTPAAPLARRPTALPFTCAPLPASFLYPPPPPGAPGAFSRCASFEVGAAQQVALSPDGRLAALVPLDGIVRVVEIASRTVVAVLAPPRATIDFAAFSPDGHAILTLASGEREVTLWGTGSFGPTWTTQLPGHRYQLRFDGGGVAFAPDGRSAAVSPGQETFLLDVASGAVRAVRPAGALRRLAYGWGRQRIVVAEPSTTSDCAPGGSGGKVTILDARTLDVVAQIADLGGRFDPRGNLGLAAFVASPVDDLVLVPAGVGDPPGIRAFTLSTGTPLPAPGLDALPFAFMPDGTRLLLRANGQLAVAAGLDGAIVASIADDGSGPVGVSSDGGTIAIGGSGPNLLRAWTLSSPGAAAVCGADAPGVTSSNDRPGVALSADGELIALGQGTNIRLVHTAAGDSPHVFGVDDVSQSSGLVLSPGLRFLVAAPSWQKNVSTIVFSLLDGGRVATLPADNWGWSDYVFSPREDELWAVAGTAAEHRLYAADLNAPGLASVATLQASTSLLGFSQGCPVLYQASRGVWRSCGSCADPPVAGAGGAAMLSPDGGLLAASAAYPDPDLTVWPMWPGATPLATFAPSPDDDAYQPLQEYPIAIAAGGGRIVTSTIPLYDCYRGPGLAVRVHDLATGALIDTLPPSPQYAGAGVAVDAAARRIAFGPQLWCSDF